MGKKSKDTLDATALRRTLGILRPHLRPHLGLIALGMVAMLGDVALRVLEPWPLKYALDVVSEALGARIPDQGMLLGLDVRGAVVACAASLALIVGTRALTNYLATVSFAKVGARVATELRSRVFDHVQSLSMRYHSKASVGDTSQRLVGDVGRLQEVAVTAGLPLVTNVITLVVLLVVLLALDLWLTVVVLAAGLGYLLVSHSSRPRITTASRKTRQGEGRLVGSAAEALGAIRVVQSYGLERSVASEFADGNLRAMKAGVLARRLAARLERSTDVIVGVAQAAVLLIGAMAVLGGRLTPGDLVLFVMYLKIAMKPLRDMAKYTGRIARAAASGERIADLLAEEQDLPDPPSPVPMWWADGRVDIHAVRSRDGYGRPLFQGLELHIPAGQAIGILGASGVGKSTLVSYLQRLADPEQGRVAVGGYDVRSVRKAELRSRVSVLLQESVLFQATVRENIRFGRLDATDAEVEHAARACGAHELIMALPEGYDTVLGVRGDTLSGGQRQRIAIARAMVRDAGVVILDEPTTGLDPATRAQVTDAITHLTRGRTTISITHDHAAIRTLDRLVWIEDGRIVEDGSPGMLAADPTTRVSRWLSGQRQEAHR